MVAAVAVGKAFGFLGNLQQGFAAGEAHDANADMLRMDAESIRQMAVVEVGRIKRARTKDIGHMTAAYGASGVTHSGSVLDAIADAAAQHDLDIEITKQQSARAMQRAQAQADSEEDAGDSARAAGWLGALGSLF